MAQDRTFNGFYVTPQHDTVKGSFPKYKEAAKSPDKIQFIPTGSATPIQLTPLDCLEATITDYDQYLSYTGKRLINPIDDVVAMDNRGYFDFHDSALSVTAFVRLVTATPQCSIYVLDDNTRTNFFYQLPAEPLQELRFKKYFDENNMHEVADYRQQLNTVFGEEIAAKHLMSTLEQLPYSEDGITDFIQKLFPLKKAPNSSASSLSGWVLGGGLSANLLKVSGGVVASEAEMEYPTSFTPYLSFGYLVTLQRHFGKYFFYPQVRFTTYKNSSEKTVFSFTERITYRSDLIILPEINMGVNIINKQTLRFFIYGGAGLTTLINNREEKEYVNPSDNTIYRTSEETLAPLALGINLSTGLTLHKRLQILVTYNLPTDIDNFAGLDSKLSSIQVGIGYKFGKH
jgi:hypothetical protein